MSIFHVKKRLACLQMIASKPLYSYILCLCFVSMDYPRDHLGCFHNRAAFRDLARRCLELEIWAQERQGGKRS